ncbi:AmiS/UreI family transporter [Aliiroseovarius sp. YM-037]|uniref:AmiS/UreI family transporter n=1 Tax=Aliiroseovarius sp. YM-037 TaxID=3341728 RepID=UPI003A7FB527
MFSATYLWVAPVAMQDMLVATTALDMLLAVSGGVWAALWLMYFLLLFARWPIQRLTAWSTTITGILTGWLPAMMLLNGVS